MKTKKKGSNYVLTFQSWEIIYRDQSLFVSNYYDKTSGIVLDFGDSNSSCVPIVKSFPI